MTNKNSKKSDLLQNSTVQTTIAARVDVGFGNNLYIRGAGSGLSWDVGILMKNVSPYEWAWQTNDTQNTIEFKLLINDELWAEGQNQFVTPGETIITAPSFIW